MEVQLVGVGDRIPSREGVTQTVVLARSRSLWKLTVVVIWVPGNIVADNSGIDQVIFAGSAGAGGDGGAGVGSGDARAIRVGTADAAERAAGATCCTGDGDGVGAGVAARRSDKATAATAARITTPI